MRELLVRLAPRSIAFALAILCCNRIEMEAGNPLSRWSWRHPVPQGLYLSGVTYGNGRFVAVGRAEENTVTKGDVLSSPIILTSADGVNWVSPMVGAHPYTGLNAVTYGNGQFVAVGQRYAVDVYGPGTIQTSTDGVNWIQRPGEYGGDLRGIAFGQGKV